MSVWREAFRADWLDEGRLAFIANIRDVPHTQHRPIIAQLLKHIVAQEQAIKQLVDQQP